MSRRTLAAVVALGLLLATFYVGHRVSADDGSKGRFTLFSPGPTINVLGKSDGRQIIDITGHKTYDDTGALRLVTIIPTSADDQVGLVRALIGWVDPDVAVFPHDTVYQPVDTNASVKQQSAQQMTSSQDNAVAAALRELKVPYSTSVQVSTVDKTGPSQGKLKSGDLIQRVDGHAVDSLAAAVKAISTLTPGNVVHLGIKRGTTTRRVDITTVAAGASGADAKRAVVKIGIQPSFDFPFGVKLRLSDNIGGPSAGTMFALGIYDLLTPGSLTDGRTIAGTGEIDARGNVGTIGGIQQKMVGAQHDGARLFLVPAGNCAEALQGHWDNEKMRLVRISTLRDALASVKAWAAKPDADLPRCTP